MLMLASCTGGSQTYDVILRGGMVIDGTGRPAYAADVATRGSTIAAVGDLSRAEAVEIVDVSGLIVAPGFINLHSHASTQGLSTAANMLTQGVTTEILNADGSSPADVGQQLREAAGVGLAINVGGNVGFNSAWSAFVGREDTRPTPAQIRSMAERIDLGLAQGAWGVSAGLDYKPAYYATVEEVVAVLGDTRRWRTLFTNHDRLTPETKFSSRVGMGETVEIGESTGLMPVITHMKVQGWEQGSVAEVLGMMTQATARGAYTAADAYPYLAGQTSLAALIIPGWAQEGGVDAMRARFADPRARARIVAEANEALVARFGGAEGVFLPDSQRELTDFMAEMGVPSGGEAVVRILTTESPTAILRFGSEPDLEGILRHPTTSVACDCDATTGPAAHPRAYGTFPRVLGRYVRERGVLTLEDAVRKMSGLPATTIGMVDRGFVAVGLAADLAVFDAGTVIDRATFTDPTARSEGVRDVMVNGVFALRDGQVTGAMAGQPLSRSRNQPARAMWLDGDRSVAIAGPILRVASGQPTGFTLRLDVSQSASQTTAKGVMVLSGPSGEEYRATELGLLQTAGSWATVSARVEDGSGELHGMTVIVDAVDPFVTGSGVTVSIAVEGMPTLTGRIAGEAVIRTPSGE
jgi:N-acyl-D-aspartate/D-glutamate deacylase